MVKVHPPTNPRLFLNVLNLALTEIVRILNKEQKWSQSGLPKPPFSDTSVGSQQQQCCSSQRSGTVTEDGEKDNLAMISFTTEGYWLPKRWLDLTSILELLLQVTHLLNQYSSRAHDMAGSRSELGGQKCTVSLHMCIRVHTRTLYTVRVVKGGVNFNSVPAGSLVCLIQCLISSLF